MNQLSPSPHPIPPELPLDPLTAPPDMPINTPPEREPSGPEPFPLGPVVPPPPPILGPRLAILALCASLMLAGAALAQKPAGKDTSELEPPNPQQAECSKITDADQRTRCVQRNQPAGGPATGKTTGDQPAAVAPSVGREVRPAPSGETRKPTDPNRPEHSR